MNTTILLSIKPWFADAILAGDKRFEFRRSIFCRPGIDRVLLYSSIPEQCVVGEFVIGGVLSLPPQCLWMRTRKYAGIKKADFDKYFMGKRRAHAIKVSFPLRYSKPLDLLQDFGLVRPPQSFCYISGIKEVSWESRYAGGSRPGLERDY
jgi:predicted transcriptional regulator